MNVALFRFDHSPLRLFYTALSAQDIIWFYFAAGGGIHLPQKKWMQALIPYVDSMEDLHVFVSLLLASSILRINHLLIIICVLSCRAPLDALNLSACLLELSSLAQPIPRGLPNHMKCFSRFEFEDILRSFFLRHLYAPPFSFRPARNRSNWEIRHGHGIDCHCSVSCKRPSVALNQMPFHWGTRLIRADDFNKIVLKYVHHLYA